MYITHHEHRIVVREGFRVPIEVQVQVQYVYIFLLQVSLEYAACLHELAASRTMVNLAASNPQKR